MPAIQTPQSSCLAGVARGDITPPIGIYHRMWGAARHDRSTGVHYPLTATVLLLENVDGAKSAADTKVYVALDHCLLWTKEMASFLDEVAAIGQVERDSIVVFFSHTHAAGLMGWERESLPGGELIRDYLHSMAATVAGLVDQARKQLAPAMVAFGYGQCSLATNRDFHDDASDQYVCGFNPRGTADGTLLVGRVTSSAGDNTLATIVNYACHPTTLAWDNTLISPDYLGAMRDTVESATQAPCFFIQGASGDVGPREGFVGDVSVADRNGRQLGYAVLATLEAIPAAMTQFEYTGPVISGATIGCWNHVPVADDRRQQLSIWREKRIEVPLAYRSDLPDRTTWEQERTKWITAEDAARVAQDAQRQSDARAMVERATRRLTRVECLPAGDVFPYSLIATRIGDAVWLELNGEHYNLLQRQLRERFPQAPLIVGTLANGSDVWYVLDAESYGKGLYQEEASILAKGALEQLIDAISTAVEDLLDDDVEN